MLVKYDDLTWKCKEGETSPGMWELGITVPFVQHSAILKLYPLHKHWKCEDPHKWSARLCEHSRWNSTNFQTFLVTIVLSILEQLASWASVDSFSWFNFCGNKGLEATLPQMAGALDEYGIPPGPQILRWLCDPRASDSSHESALHISLESRTPWMGLAEMHNLHSSALL